MRVQNNAAWVETNIYADSDAIAPGRAICAAVSSYVYSTENTVGLTGLTVRASDGQRLALRTSPQDPC